MEKVKHRNSSEPQGNAGNAAGKTNTDTGGTEEMFTLSEYLQA